MTTHRISLIFLLLLPILSQATHDVGVEMHYECLNNCTVRVYFHHYIHCSGSSGTGQNNVSIEAVGTANCGSATPLNNWTFLSDYEKTPVCPTVYSDCINPGNNLSGFREVIHFRDYSICGSSCQGFKINWTSCCRSSSGTTSSTGWHLDGGYIDLSHPQCNNSPRFLQPMPVYFPNSDISSYSLAALDPDGDSLAYFLDSCYSAPGIAVSYQSGFTPQQPFGNGWNLSLDPVSGILTVDPGNGGGAGIFYVSVLVKEYRNGIMIGSIKREIEAYTLAAQNDMPVAGLTNVQGAVQSGQFYLESCPGQQVCFDLEAVDSNPGQSVNISWDKSISGPVFSDAMTGNPMDTVSGLKPKARFCWTPSAPGTYSMTFRVWDDACPVYGENNYSVTLLVDSSSKVKVLALPDSCGKYIFSALPQCGEFSSWSWTGTGGINSTDSTFIHQFTSPGTYNYSLTAIDTGGALVTVNGSLSVPGVSANAQASLDSCLSATFSGAGTGNGIAYT